ncbi:MAG: glycine C-acetyltransferase [Oscillospiraceae bacterium]|nr:glycine C-acetyltransferase [Oscillospiraceae bacterium]
MKKEALSIFQETLDEIKGSGLYKEERVLTAPQSSHISTETKADVINMCANNYLGLANHPRMITAAKDALDRLGFGMASVRFICGTGAVHKELEEALSGFLGMEDTLLYSSCFDANTGLFETLLGKEDAIFSDQLNHASVIDGVRLCKAARYTYQNNDMADLEAKLKEATAAGSRIKLIATDGVFSMDGYIANLPAICDLADRYDALVMVDDSHAVGFWGPNGAGTPAYHGVTDRVDIITGTLGKALGGASGGYTSARREIIALLRQRSRPYLFSNSLAPSIAAATLEALHMITESDGLRDQLRESTGYYREALQQLGFDILPGEHPIVPIMFYDARVASEFANRMLDKGVYVTAFSFPVVPKERARIRTQVSGAHSRADLDRVLAAFAGVKQDMGL